MRIVVIGAGEVGSNIAASLADANEIVVIDSDSERVEDLKYTYDVLALEGDGTSLDTLEEAHIEKSDLVIASTDKDETNLVICGTVKILSNPFTIARVRKTEFLETWRRSNDAFGVDFMVGTNLLAAESIVRVAGLPAARDVDLFAGGRIQMAEFDITETSPIVNQTVEEADQWDQLTFAALLSEDNVTIPIGSTVIEPGYELVVIGTPESVREFAEVLSPDSHQATDIVVIGGGPIGEETARLLEGRVRNPRLVVEEKDRARYLAEKLSDTVVLFHDATDIEFLIRENIDKADLIVVALESDERNLLVSLLAKQIGTKRAVAVVQDGDYVKLFEAVGIDIAINPRIVTAEEITRFTHTRYAENVALIESDLAEVLEFEINEESVLANRPIRESVEALPEGVVIGAITRRGEVVTPRGDTTIEPGDHVVVFVDTRMLEEVLEKI